MPKRLIPALSKEQQAELVDLQKHSPKPYLRERAGAILKLAKKHTAIDIASHGLLQKRHRETVSTWLRRYEAQPSRRSDDNQWAREKARFFPLNSKLSKLLNSYITPCAQSPENFGFQQARRTLEAVRGSVSWLSGLTLSGVWRHLERAGIAWKRGREVVASPDAGYLEKLLEKSPSFGTGD